ncbi:MAG: thiamine pyrophosphate-binding protein [Cyclobacteriaceae bacterium]|nr:thiamine pyrophosphate-binding protein [Cyclobacteriaceae bacterium]
MDGGHHVARVLREEGIQFLFTLCGGHISPILVAAKHSGIRVIDTRHEVNAVFAADATARITGTPGVAAVTAGPGITNTITAIKNALLAQSPVVLLGGAAPTLLKGRGALQDIDQMALMKPNVKWAAAVRSVGSIYPTLKKAFRIAREGVPGPVFVELPLDILYDEQVVRAGFEKTLQNSVTIPQRITAWYIKRHLDKVFKPQEISSESSPAPTAPTHRSTDIDRAVKLIQASARPVAVIGSGALMLPTEAGALSESLLKMDIPVYLSGMARGVLGSQSPVQFRHHRKEALREADLVILAGVPCDFRLEYGRHIHSRANVISINRSQSDLTKNRRPTLGVLADPLRFLVALSKDAGVSSSRWENWKKTLRDREQSREDSIRQTGSQASDGLHPVALFLELEKQLDSQALFVADGGDFVGTASYIVRPRTPLSWLDPGVFGTLGIGGGFAVGAKLCRPENEVVIIYGDGSAAYSLAEFDTFVRHRLPVIAIVGNDASWSQIARDQVDILKDDCGTVLAHSDYEKVAEAFGGKGRRVTTVEEFNSALEEARRSVRQGIPFLINAILQKSDFRKGSLSM